MNIFETPVPRFIRIILLFYQPLSFYGKIMRPFCLYKGGVEGGVGFPTMLTGLKSRRKLMRFQTDFFHFKDLRSPIIRMKTKQSVQVQNSIGI